MDDDRFDGIAKRCGVSTGRRRMLGLLAALGIGWATGGIESGGAKKSKQGRKSKGGGKGGKGKGGNKGKGNRGKGNRGNKPSGNKPTCKGDPDCPGCLSCVDGRCRNIPEQCDLLDCEELACEPPSAESAKSYYKCKSWCSGDEFYHHGKCCPKGVQTCGPECCAAGEFCKDGACVENPCADEHPFTKTCPRSNGGYFCCEPCHQCCSATSGVNRNRCCQPATCGATCDDGWCIGGTSSCSCPMP